REDLGVLPSELQAGLAVVAGLIVDASLVRAHEVIGSARPHVGVDRLAGENIESQSTVHRSCGDVDARVQNIGSEIGEVAPVELQLEKLHEAESDSGPSAPARIGVLAVPVRAVDTEAAGPGRSAEHQHRDGTYDPSFPAHG